LSTETIKERSMATKRAPPWKKARPKNLRARTKLTPAKKAAAKKRAASAGRRYPNLVDNMWAAKKTGAKKVAKKATKKAAKK
jgi:hypothetical protein